MSPLALPPDYPRVRRVHSFAELVGTPFAHGVNALCWPRPLPGDFSALIAALGPGTGIRTLDDAQLRALPLTPAGQAARDHLLADLRLLRDHHLDPVLNCIHQYPRDENPGPVPTDVFSFHTDSATVETDTYLCTYHGPASEGLRNDQAQRRIDDPQTRAALLRDFGGDDNDAFCEHLSENCYDLHYTATPDATPFNFGLGHLWRIAVDYPGSPVPPCIHRAPHTTPNDPPRLLLIS